MIQNVDTSTYSNPENEEMKQNLLDQNDQVKQQNKEFDNQDDDDQDKYFVSKKKSYRVTGMRWLALFFACTLMLGNYMSYDFPTYLQNQIGQEVFGCENFSDKTPECKQYQKYYPWLYTVYSLPNTVLPLFGGLFVDRLGVRLGLIVFSTILFVGQFFCASSGFFAGGWSNNPSTVFVFFYIGRVIFSLGGENMSVSQSTVVSAWFVGKELAFALGTNISVSRLGSVAGGFVLPALYKSSDSLTFPLFFAVILCAFSIIMVFCLVFLDKKADQQEGKIEKAQMDPSEQVNIKDIKTFPLIYWILTVSCLLNYICIFVFLQFGNDFLQSRYCENQDNASQLITLPYIISAVLSPIIGFMADKIGKRQYLLMLSSCIMLVAHVLWLAIPTCTCEKNPDGTVHPIGPCNLANQLIPLILMGLFYSFYAAIMWPCIPLVLEEKVVGTGFGVTTAVQNLGLALAPLAVQQIISASGDYVDSQIFFISTGVICVLLQIWVIILNAKIGDPLGKVTKLNPKMSNLKKSMVSKASFHH